MGFYIFGTFISYYGLCIVIGLVCAFLIGYYLCKKTNLNTDDFILICAYLISFGFLGAKILYILVSFKTTDFRLVLKSVKTFNYYISSGFVFYGGVIGGLFALFLVKKIHKLDVYEYCKVIVPCLCIAHSFGRIGCSLAGCCHGRITTGRIYFLYKHSIAAPNNVKLFPIQGIEAISVFIIGIVCTILVLRRAKVKVEYLYMISYAMLRFILEFFRGDQERGFFLIFSTSQIISIAIIIVVSLIALFNLKHKKQFL